MIPTANEYYHAAQKFIREGQPVFPCRPAGKRAKAPLTQHGLDDATLDVAQVKRWWKRYGSAALGITTGVLWDVLDVDIKVDEETGKKIDGRVHLPRLRDLGLLNGCRKVARTPSGGWHLYFNASPEMTNKARAATLGLDVRALGGYVIAAPSFIETPDYAGVYEEVGDTIGATSEPLYWDLIVSSLRPINTTTNEKVAILPSDRQTSIAALREWVSTLKSGERNNGLHWAVCRCIENGIDPHELVEPALLIGLEESEILLTVGSALRRAGVTADELDTEAEALFPDAVA